MAVLLVFGDSIAWGAWDPDGGGWVQRLKRSLDQKTLSDPEFHCLVYNLGISGNDTDALVERFAFEARQRLKEIAEEAVVLFAIGINDAQYIRSRNTNRVPLERFEQNLHRLIQDAQTLASKVVLMEITPVDESKTAPVAWNPDKSYLNAEIQRYNRVLRNLSDQYHVPLVEVYDAMVQFGHPPLLWDGLHPNARGHQWIAEQVRTFLFEHSIL